MIQSQNAVTACVLLNGHDLPRIAPVKYLIFRLSPKRRESVCGQQQWPHSLPNEFDCGVSGKMLLSSSCGRP